MPDRFEPVLVQYLPRSSKITCLFVAAWHWSLSLARRHVSWLMSSSRSFRSWLIACYARFWRFRQFLLQLRIWSHVIHTGIHIMVWTFHAPFLSYRHWIVAWDRIAPVDIVRQTSLAEFGTRRYCRAASKSPILTVHLVQGIVVAEVCMVKW